MDVNNLNLVGNHYNPFDVYSAGAAGAASRTEGAAGSQGVTSGAGVVFSEMRSKVAFALATPEIADALNLTPEERQEYLAAAAEKATSATVTLGRKSVMLDIYAVLELIREMSQQLRNAMREMRQLENQSIQANIKQQAATQRSAAWCQMIGGAVVGLLQGVGSVVGLAKQISSFNRQATVNQQLGVDMADKQLNMAKVGGNQELAATQLKKVEAKIPEGVRAEVKMTKADQITGAGQKIDTVKSEIAQLETEKAAKKDLIANGRPAADGGQKEQLSVPEKQKLWGECYEIDQKIAAKQNELAGAYKDYGKALGKAEVPTARLSAAEEQQAVHQALLEDVGAYQKGYEAALSRANSEQRINGKVSLEAKGALQEAGQKYELARAKQVAQSSQMEHVSPGEHQKVETALSDDLAVRTKQATAQAKTTASERSMAYGMIIQQLAMAGGQMGQQIVNGIAEIIRSEGTELQADQKQLEEQLDQIKDLFQQDLSVIQKANELFQSVVSKETQSLDEIINALKA